LIAGLKRQVDLIEPIRKELEERNQECLLLERELQRTRLEAEAKRLENMVINNDLRCEIAKQQRRIVELESLMTDMRASFERMVKKTEQLHERIAIATRSISRDPTQVSDSDERKALSSEQMEAMKDVRYYINKWLKIGARDTSKDHEYFDNRLEELIGDQVEQKMENTPDPDEA
jgi:hypothetical protein